MNVEVLDIPVRYGDTTYQPGETFKMKKEHIDEKLVKIIEKQAVKK